MHNYCIVNPTSKKNRNRQSAISGQLKGLANDRYFETGKVEELDDLLAQFNFAPHDLLIISGGDGTFHAVLSALLRRLNTGSEPVPRIALIPTGSTNLSALDIHGRISPEQALSKLQMLVKSAPCDWPTLSRRLIRVQTDANATDQFGFSFGIGAIAKGVQYFQSHTRNISDYQELGAGLASLRVLFGLLTKEASFSQGVPIKVSIEDGPAREFNCMLIIASTLERMILGLRYHWSQGNQPIGYVEFSDEAPRLIPALLGIVSGKIPDWMEASDHYNSYRFNQAYLDFSGDFMLDGEIMTAPEGIRLSGSRALDFVTLTNKAAL